MHKAVCAHFDKDQYPLFMKQLESLKQTGSMAEYQAKFEQLSHSILLYNPSYDDVYFVTRFLGGLKEEIRAPITLHHPPNLETAGTLALLQEAELELSRTKMQSKSEFRDTSTYHSRNTVGSDRHKFRKEEAKTVDQAQSNASADKLSTLKAFR